MKIKFFYIYIPVLLILISCGEKFTPPEKPQNVPTSAVYAGGPDGGTWIDCIRKRQSKFVYLCKRYDEETGLKASEGFYKLKSFYWSKKLEKPIYADISNVQLKFDNADALEEIILLNRLILVRTK